jgi:uncharacterized protein YjiS (DUF1127 family)
MEIFMNRFYVATIVAAVATILLASRVLMLRGSRSAIPGMLARVRFDLGWVLRGARNLVDDLIAASIAKRERRAAIFALERLSDRELKDMGLHRGSIGHVGYRCEQGQLDRMRGRSAMGATDEVGR